MYPKLKKKSLIKSPLLLVKTEKNKEKIINNNLIMNNYN